MTWQTVQFVPLNKLTVNYIGARRTHAPMGLTVDPGPTTVCTRCACTVAEQLWSTHVQWHKDCGDAWIEYEQVPGTELESM